MLDFITALPGILTSSSFMPVYCLALFMVVAAGFIYILTTERLPQRVQIMIALTLLVADLGISAVIYPSLIDHPAPSVAVAAIERIPANIGTSEPDDGGEYLTQPPKGK
jgi:hypothetical protein